MDLVSIIVPVYNVEKYVEECVQSLLAQSYKKLEIILVDDGSLDKSGEICDNLCLLDNRIKVLHKKNGGLSDARNHGIDVATGKYVMFVDSDDIVDGDIVQELYSYITAHQDLKLVVSELTHFFDENVPVFLHEKNVEVIEKNDAIKEFLYQKRIPTSACGKLYLKSILNNIRFVKGQRFEDNEFVFKVLLKSDKVAVNKSKLYAYRHRSNSITTAKFGEKEFDIIEIGKRVLEESNSIDNSVKIASIAYQCTNCFRIYMTASDEFAEDSRFEYCKDFLSNNVRTVIRKSEARFKLKLGLVLFQMRIPRRVIIYLRKKKRRWD